LNHLRIDSQRIRQSFGAGRRGSIPQGNRNAARINARTGFRAYMEKWPETYLAFLRFCILLLLMALRARYLCAGRRAAPMRRYRRRRLRDLELEKGTPATVTDRHPAHHPPALARGRVAMAGLLALTPWRQISCDGGYPRGCTLLGGAYWVGSGVAMDEARGAMFMQRACDSDDAEGCATLGKVYELGAGATKDVAHALALYQKACRMDYKQACDYATHLQ
jgi:TPR repeat protein